ncbi:MAG: DnaD domain protein [Oscillospiraceae bacterium]|jgi:hypothetical protein|nr:DnaD domain protein [Oscillospiraceae bacterium]
MDATKNITIPESAARELLRLGDGDACLLYLFLAAHGGDGTPDDAARSFSWDSSRLRSASDKLLTLIAALTRDNTPASDSARAVPDAERDTPSEPPPVPPAPAPRVSAKRNKPDERQFSSLVTETQRIFGRVLSADELLCLLGIHNNLKLPPEVILQLIRFCMTEMRRLGDGGSVPRMREVEKRAYAWEREGIFTLEAAERYIKEREAQHNEVALIKKSLQIGNRELSKTEREYVERWIALGFSSDETAIAYDRTIMKTGQLAWPYMDSIMNSWHKKGLHTAAEIAERDTRAEKTAAYPKNGVAARPVPDQNDFERMQRLLSGISGAGQPRD